MSGSIDSAAVEGQLSLLGVWIHDPLSPESSAANFPYGTSTRSSTIDVPVSDLVYAGRTYPVTEFGEHESDKVSARVDVPHGPNWASQLSLLEAFARARRTLCFRDNRGRRVFGPLSGYSEDDADYGTAVAVSFTQVDYSESIA